MQGKHLYEYAVVRVVPRVEREEFVNVGVILYCKSLRFLETKFHINNERIHAFSGAVDCDEISHHLNAFREISLALPGSGPIGALDAAARFRWLTATRSTVVQCSKVHPGFCEDAAVTLEALFQKLVL